MPCGNVTLYCPLGSEAPQVVQSGYYSDGAAGAVAVNTSTMVRQVECPPGYWCTGGLAYGCPGGTYQDQARRTSATDCLDCPAGLYCGEFWCRGLLLCTALLRWLVYVCIVCSLMHGALSSRHRRCSGAALWWRQHVLPREVERPH